MNTRLDDQDQRLHEPKWEFMYCLDEFLRDKEESQPDEPRRFHPNLECNYLSDGHKSGNRRTAYTAWSPFLLEDDNEYAQGPEHDPYYDED